MNRISEGIDLNIKTYMKSGKLIATMIVSVLLMIAFASLTPVGAQNTSMSQSVFNEQASEQLTEASLNPAWIEYEQNRTAGKAIIATTAEGNSMGYIPSPVDLSHLKGKISLSATETYPSYYDLRTADPSKVTSVKDQGAYGTCWAFATFGSLESYLMPEERDFSEYNLATQSGFDYAWDDGGQLLMSTAYLGRWSGPVNENDDPYPSNGVQSETDNTYASTIQKHTQDVYFLDNSNIKWGLMNYGGVGVAFNWNSAYYNATSKSYYNPSATAANHAVTIVGWDDNYAGTNFIGSPANGAFIVKNSWGTSWGESGYFYLSYYDASLNSATVFTAEPTSNYGAVYQYDPLGYVGSYGFSSTTAWGANVFTADNSAAPLTAVSFYTNDVNTKYEIYIYTNPNSGPIGGTKNIGPKGTMPMAGYHTVKLTSPISLSAGQRFSVVVKYTTSTYRYPLVAEYALAGYSSKATASRGQSYISSNGISWTDLTTYKSTANICIKAFTSVVTNNPPQTPSQPQGPTSSKRGVTCSYTTSTTDPDGDRVKYTFDWGDGKTSTTEYNTASATHTWLKRGSYYVKAMATDEHGAISGWSTGLKVTIS